MHCSEMGDEERDQSERLHDGNGGESRDNRLNRKSGPVTSRALPRSPCISSEIISVDRVATQRHEKDLTAVRQCVSMSGPFDGEGGMCVEGTGTSS